MLGHIQVRICVTDGQQAIGRKDGLAAPPPQVPKRQALDDTPRERLYIRERQRAPEAALREAVGQATAKRERRAVGGKPVDEVLRERNRALAESLRAPWIRLVGQSRVDQPVVVEAEWDVVVALCGHAIRVPAISEIELL